MLLKACCIIVEVIMEPMVIEVHGVPGTPPQDRMVDQLKIHFLKRRNSGGDVLMVIYPTSTPGQAYVIFESKEVPEVLECSHILDFDNRFYPLQVKKAHLSEVDMRAETMLDLSMFPNRKFVLTLLKDYGFNVTEPIQNPVQLKGSFLKLKLLRNELMQLQRLALHSPTRSPSAVHNGSTLGYDMEHNNSDFRFVSKSVSRNMDKTDAVSQRQLPDSAPSLSCSYKDLASGRTPRTPHISQPSYTERSASSPVDAVVQKYQRQDNNELLAHRQHHLAGGALSLATGGYPSIGNTNQTLDTMQHHTSYRDSSSGELLRRRPSFDGDTRAISSHSIPSSSSREMASFPVDKDIMNFILTKHQDVVNKIRENYGTEMVLQESTEFTMVKFLGKNSEKGKACFLNIIKELSSSLRTQEIHLKEYNQADQKQILERIQRNKESGVMITQLDDVVKLVGSARESFEMMQKIMGHNDDRHRGRTMERGSKSRRSSSLPRHYKMAGHAHNRGPENQASAANRNSPSHYQEESDEGKAPEIVQSPEQTPDRNSQWTRSNSESRDKNRTTRDQSIYTDRGLVTTSEEKKSPKSQQFKNFLKFRFDLKPKNTEIKEHLRNKSHSTRKKAE